MSLFEIMSKKWYYLYNMRGEQRPCKFGPNCNKLAQGTCTYYHPPSDLNSMQPQQPRGPQGSGFQHHHQGNYPPKSFNPTNPNYPQNPRQPPNAFNPNYNPNFNPNLGPKGFKQGMGSEDPVQKQLCRNFHLGIECKFGEKCRNKHAFLLAEEGSLKRIQFIRTVPFHPLTKLSKFKSGDKNYYALRNGNDINFFDFNVQTKVLGDVFKYTLPDPNGKYNFYDHKNQFIYYSKENPDTFFEDMGVYNLQLLKNYLVSNSHQGKITGMAHFDSNVLLSTSMNGELKVWITQGDQLKCHNDISQRLKSNFNPQNAKIQLYFIDISEVSGMKVIAIGTSDGRLLFFFGQDLAFKQVQLPEQNSKVFRVRYANRQNVPTALVLTWNSTKTYSSVLQIDLGNFTTRNLVEVRTTEDQTKAMLNLFELVHGYLMVANLHGFVSIYKYPDTTNKIGGIFHQNQISDILQSEEELKNTKLTIKTMFILEKRTEQKEGSLGIYVMK